MLRLEGVQEPSLHGAVNSWNLCTLRMVRVVFSPGCINWDLIGAGHAGISTQAQTDVGLIIHSVIYSED